MKSMVTIFKPKTKGGNKVKKIGLLAAVMALVLVIGASAAYAAPGQYPIDGSPDYTSVSDFFSTQLTETSGPMLDPDGDGTPDNGINNANNTGIYDDGSGYVTDTTGQTENFLAAVKNVDAQATHGNYQNDTNSCASCHQTHTAAGDQLLFKDGIYNTCVACHDGTLGFYNVLELAADPASASNAGTFGGDPAGTSKPSVHLATGAVQISFAPGGDRSGTDARWNDNFTCASCHAPHGSYSDRLLHYNPNHAADVNAKLAQAAAYDAVVSKYTVAAVPGPWLYGSAPDTDLLNNPSGVKYETQIKVNGSVFNSATNKNWNDEVNLDYRKGQFTFKDNSQPANVTVDIIPAFETKLVKVANGFTPNNVQLWTVTGYTKGVNAYCGACHTDYDAEGTGAGNNAYGTYSQAFRHPMGVKTGDVGLPNENGNLVCLSCHFAHGTTQDIMKNADETATAAADLNVSSALKRYVNMAVCWKCHQTTLANTLANDGALYVNKYGQ